MSPASSSHAVNPWLLLSHEDLRKCEHGSSLVRRTVGNTTFDLCHARKSLWMVVRWSEDVRVAFCLINSLGADAELIEQHMDEQVRMRLKTPAGMFATVVDFPTSRRPVFHWRTTLRPFENLAVPFWLRDIVPLGEDADPSKTLGVIHTTQRGPQGNFIYASLTAPGHGSMLYLQNLGALSAYFEQTKTSAADTIGGTWPEIGFALPAAPVEHPLQAERDYVISDAYFICSNDVPTDDVASARQFLDLYAQVYLAMDKPVAIYRNWPRRVSETLQDLTHSPKCGVEIDDHRYLRAYAGSDDRPPESMVQLSVLVPMIEYAESREESIPLIEMLKRNVQTFVGPDVPSIARWLPSQSHLLQGQEEHMKPELMDSWYLWHTLLNLARLAQLGDAKARSLFLKSIEHGIQVARRFDYQWPVFYDMHTLEVIKAETEPGSGGEHDVGALYAQVMIKAYELTDDRRFIDEATNAARKLEGLGFDLAYQYNNVSFGAGALFRLWKETGDERFRGLSDVCWANVIANLWLWEGKYGHAKNYSTFMGLPPLRNAKYIALYEELEVLAAMHEYLRVAGDNATPALRVLLPEYGRYLIDRAWYHYPSELPGELLDQKPQSGELLRYISVPLEDLYEGWEKPGKVGQEVYGAAAPFIIATRHCHRIKGENFQLHCSYPVADLEYRRTARAGQATLRMVGDAQCRCHIRAVPATADPLPQFQLHRRDGNAWRECAGTLADLGYVEWEVPGDAVVRVDWKHSRVPERLNGTPAGVSGEKVNPKRKINGIKHANGHHAKSNSRHKPAKR